MKSQKYPQNTYPVLITKKVQLICINWSHCLAWCDKQKGYSLWQPLQTHLITLQLPLPRLCYSSVCLFACWIICLTFSLWSTGLIFLELRQAGSVPQKKMSEIICADFLLARISGQSQHQSSQGKWTQHCVSNQVIFSWSKKWLPRKMMLHPICHLSDNTQWMILLLMYQQNVSLSCNSTVHN